MLRLLKKSTGVIKTSLALGIAFYAGFIFSIARDRVLYEFPVQGSIKSAQTAAPATPPVGPAAFEQIGLDKRTLRAKRAELERKVFGKARAAAQPTSTEIGLDAFVDEFASRENFEKFLKPAFSNRKIRITVLSGDVAEIPGYRWRSVLLRQTRGNPAGLFIYHQGHDGSPFAFRSANMVIRTMLERGYDVAAFSMPGIGWNRIGHVRIKTWDGWGYVSSKRDPGHDLFSMIDTGAGHFIKFFVEPVFATIDHAEVNQHYRQVVMAGHSGGGWATTLAAAIDPRIDHSVSYAGTLPFFARRTHGDRGDTEQIDAGFYREFPYPLLYDLASLSDGRQRTHTQLFHSEDTCCFDSGSVAIFQEYLESRGYQPDRDLRVKVLRGRGHFVYSDAILDIVGKIGTLQATR